MARALEAMIIGMRAVTRAPAVVVGTYLLLVAVVLPATLALTSVLAAAFDRRALDLVAGPVVEEDWFGRANEASRQVVGDSFAPSMIGFAAPLSNLADLASSRSRSLPSTGALIAWLAAWTFVLGGVLQRFAGTAPIGARAFLRACFGRVLPFSAISLGCLAIYAAAVSLCRALPHPALLVPMAMALGFVSIAAGYTRARIVIEGVWLGPALAATARMMRSAPLTCAAHAGAALVGWIGLLAAFAAADLLFGRGGQPWRAIVLMQAFIVARLALRLVWEASTLHVVRTLE